MPEGHRPSQQGTCHLPGSLANNWINSRVDPSRTQALNRKTKTRSSVPFRQCEAARSRPPEPPALPQGCSWRPEPRPALCLSALLIPQHERMGHRRVSYPRATVVWELNGTFQKYIVLKV